MRFRFFNTYSPVVYCGYGPICNVPFTSQCLYAPYFVICQKKESGRDPNLKPNPNPVHKELSTVTYRNSDTKGMLHKGRVTYWTLSHVGYTTQRAGPVCSNTQRKSVLMYMDCFPLPVPTCSGVPWTQESRFPLLRIQELSNVYAVKPELGQNRVLTVTADCEKLSISKFCFPDSFNFISPSPL